MHADVNELSWRKSSYSNSDGASCVEVSDDVPGAVPVRDSKQAGGGPVVVFAGAAWASFIQDVKRDRA
ncbi:MULTISPECIES: DUF397 domain-containing protein [Streptomyces]|uniref:DUF397 domain-containing protein n=1 Tax=Streptomyces katrae TaxID=68223 RepID=A0A0F4J3C5_9ACTN|nr:DUF397 domain-containing protein [Streptomyces katrae]KJY28857.1 hypothetical protein VR44_24330 [Streptomyces katrae]